MLAENPDPYAIEMKGENSLLTMHPETVAEHLKQEDPTALLKKHDEIINIEHKISGLSKDGVGLRIKVNIPFILLKTGIRTIICMRLIIEQLIVKAI